MTVAPEGRKLLRLEARNAQTPIERKPPWIKTRLRTGPEYKKSKPAIIAAGVTRLVSRALIGEGMRAAGNTESGLLGTVLGLATEAALVAADRPDTRSWTFLPGRYLATRVAVPPGEHVVEISFDGSGAGLRRHPVTVAPGGLAAIVVTEPR